MTETIRVDLAGRDYHVRIGAALLDEAGAEVAPLLNRPRLTVVADARVAALHGGRLQAGLEAGGVSSEIVTVPPGEGSKSFAELERLCGRLLDLNLDRRDTLAAFGGGVVGDLAGFAAAIYKRGLPFIQIPTTLLAQVDSSVGGKTAIDTAHGKNLIGAFHQPRLVLASTAVLGTLPPRELRAGLAEVIKAALIEDAAFFAELERDLGALLALEPAAIQAAIARAVRIKAAIVAADEFETTGRRALLNLGHTFGHAIEAEDGFDGLLHGEAVAIGCVLALRFSASEGLCARADAERAEALFAAAGLPTRLPPGRYRADALLARMAQDKKNTGGLTLILARGLGRAYVAPGVDPAAVRAFLIAEGALP